MLVTLAILLGFLGQLSNGIPLEDESSEFSQFFKQERIVGGASAANGRSPHMVALVAGHTWRSFICGGSIISEKHILTAAHCITIFVTWDGILIDSFHGTVGSNTWHNGTIIEFINYKVHPHYNPLTMKHDVGVLYTKQKIQLSVKVSLISLNPRYVDGNEKAFVTGWGTQLLWGNIPDELQILYVTIISALECIKRVQALSQEGWSSPSIDPGVDICTFHSYGHGMCHGDSGSALVSCKSKEQVGIVSWGFPCAIGAPDVFVRISGVIGFISECINESL